MHELTCGVLVSKRLSKGFVSRPRNGQHNPTEGSGEQLCNMGQS